MIPVLLAGGALVSLLAGSISVVRKMVDRIGAERSLLHTLQSDPDLRLRIEEHLTRSNSDARLREQDIDAVTADILESYKGKPEERKSLESTLLQGSSTGRAAYVNKVLNNFS